MMGLGSFWVGEHIDVLEGGVWYNQKRRGNSAPLAPRILFSASLPVGCC